MMGIVLVGGILAAAPCARAQNDDLHIQELMAGANGDSRIQFIVIEQHATGENLWGPQVGETQSRAVLVFFDASGRMTGEFRFPANPPTGGSMATLIATREFAALSGAPRPDVEIPPLLNAIGGAVCFRNNPLNALADVMTECVSYGGFTDGTGLDTLGAGAGPPAPALPIVNTNSLRRNGNTGRNSDFMISTVPEPRNIVGETFTIPLAGQIAQGEALFANELFAGNGRTCASCHVARDGFGLSPADVQARFLGLSTPTPSFDPLFIGESSPSTFDIGFDFNLNTLLLTAEIVTPAPCTGELRGLITSANGARAKVLTRIGPTAYLVYGGLNPRLSGAVSDGSCAAGVQTITPGDLALSPDVEMGLEDPQRMRDTRNPVFPEGRALILENIDGFGNAPVFRKSPHLLNLASTAPYGLSGEFEDLSTFATGAVVQHAPRSLARSDTGPNPDFRLPTPEELGALEAFMLAQEFPSGDDPNKFDLARFATTEEQRKGREEFFDFGCATCHGGPTLSETTVSILGKPEGVNATFNTGTTSVSIRDPLPCEPVSESVGPCGSREFSTPQLFNLPNVGPYFHNGSARTIAEAVDFYGSFAFGRSPAGQELIFQGIGIIPTDSITRFLEGLVERPFDLGEAPVRFGSQGVDSGPTLDQAISLTNTSSSELNLGDAVCRLAGANPEEFAISDCPVDRALEPGETRTILVAFDPTSDGLKSAILEIHSGAGAPAGIDLFGVGGAPGPPPALLDVTASSGTPEGGDTIALRGENFSEGATVTVGGVPAGWVSVVSSTLMTVRTGPHAPGPADVVVVNPDGQRSVLEGGYSFVSR